MWDKQYTNIQCKKKKKKMEAVMPMCNLMKYKNCSEKIIWSFWQYCRHKPNVNLADSESLISKIKIDWSTLLTVIQKILK